MTEQITPGRFHEAGGVEDWRVLWNSACAHFRTGSFAAGVNLVDAIGTLADAANHHPDVDLRYGSVTVRLTTHEVQGLSERDLTLARQISLAAGELGIPADPSAVQVLNLSIDALARTEVMPFWRALLDYSELGDEDLIDPNSENPWIWFQQMDAPRPERNTIHVDIAVPHDQAEARVAAAVAAGGRVVDAENAPSWWVLADAEGNEACVATWVGRG